MTFRPCVLAALICARSAFALSSPDGEPQKAGDEQVLFGDLPKVEAAALHAQTLAEAPANVSVITAEQIHRYGYRTLGEALASVRGFYVTYDHQYHYVGARGVSLPGDFNTRFLVMLNGHPLTENIYNSNGFFGQDFGLDMELVERIEIIRGPTSALYGSNGMLANINVVTRSPVDSHRLLASADTDSDGERKLSLSSSVYLGRGANLLVSASVFNNAGISLDLDGQELPAGVQSPVANADGERGYHTFANLIWHNWSLTAYFNSRDKQPPVGSGTSLSGDPSQHIVDKRNLIGAAYRRQIGAGEIRWQTYYDQYRYQDRFDYPDDGDIVPVRDLNRGDWFDSQLAYALPAGRLGLLTVGVEGSWELRAQQYNVEDGSRQDYTNRPDRRVAFFAQQEWSVSPRWKLYGGVRLDDTRYFGRAVSPRLAAIFQQSNRTVYKLVYGRPFRNPSVFEQFYNDGGLSYMAAPPLHPEIANTFEASVERQVAARWTLVVNGFHYRISNVIQAVSLANEVVQYRNAGRVRSTGLEFELTGKLWNQVEINASLALAGATGGTPLAWLANSPRQVSKARLGTPIFRRALGDRLFVTGSLQHISARNSWTGDRLGGVVLADFTATARVHPHFDLRAGVRNAFNRRYEDPIYLTVDRLRGDERSAFLGLVWRICE